MPGIVKECEVAEIAFFRYLTENEKHDILPWLERRSLTSGKPLIVHGQTGSGVFFLRHGFVKVCAPSFDPSEERSTILNICGTGDILGEMDAMTGSGHSADVVTLEKTELLWMSTCKFQSCLTEHPKVLQYVNQVLVQRLQFLSAKESARAALPLEGRVARQILLLVRDHGRTTAKGVKLPIRLAQRDIAALVGSTRERINKTISLFRKHGCLSHDADGKIVVTDCASLGAYCAACQDHSSLMNSLAR